MDIWQPLFPRMSMLEVQTRLTRLGFAPGACDGRYGPRTRDAVRQCQVAYRLVADGIPGPELKRLLSYDLPSCRITVRVGEGQTLSSVARASGTTVEALIEGNRRKRYEDVYPGESLVIHRRAVGVLADPWVEAGASVCDPDVAYSISPCLPWSFSFFPMFSVTSTGEISSNAKSLGLASAFSESERDDWTRMHVSSVSRGRRRRTTERGSVPVSALNRKKGNEPVVGSFSPFPPGARECAAAASAEQRHGRRDNARLFALLSAKLGATEGIGRLLGTGRARIAAVAREMATEAAASGAAGVAIDTLGIREEESSKYSWFITCLARGCHKFGMKLAMVIPAPCWQRNESDATDHSDCARGVSRISSNGVYCHPRIARRMPWPSGYDVEMLGAVADMVLLDIEDAASFWESLVWGCEHIPRWKLMAVLELRAYRREEGESVYWRSARMSRDELRDFMARHVVREGRDESSGIPYLSYRSRGVVRRVWQEDAESLGKKLHTVNRFNILGVAFRGAEDAREQVLEEVLRRFIIM